MAEKDTRFLASMRDAFKAHVLDFDPLDYGSFVKWTSDWGVSRGLLHILVFVGLLSVLSQQIPAFGSFTWSWIAGTAPLWLPVVLWIAAWACWVVYVRSLFLAGRDPVLLEIRVPRNIVKSPRAMEVALTTFQLSSGESNFIARAWNGAVRPFFSLEIVSFGGDIHLYIWTWKSQKNTVENALYAQYPDIEIHEADDYATAFRYDPHTLNAFVTDFELDKDDVYPIRSYIDYELDKDPKDEYRIDPFAQVLEPLGNLKPYEQIWLQIIIRKEGKSGILLRSDTGWKKRIDAEVKKIRDADDDDSDSQFKFPRPTWAQTRTMEALERHKGKPAFEVGIRGLYLSDGPGSGVAINAMRGIFRPYNSPMLNGIGCRNEWGHNIFDFAWQDVGGYRSRLMTSRYIDAYRRRSYFTEPWITPSFIMSSEAVATIFHPPTATVMTPGFTRIPATKAEPPANLPM